MKVEVTLQGIDTIVNQANNRVKVYTASVDFLFQRGTYDITKDYERVLKLIDDVEAWRQDFQKRGDKAIDNFKSMSSQSITSFQTNATMLFAGFNRDKQKAFDDFDKDKQEVFAEFDKDATDILDSINQLQQQADQTLRNFKSSSSQSITSFQTNATMLFGNFARESTASLANFNKNATAALDDMEQSRQQAVQALNDTRQSAADTAKAADDVKKSVLTYEQKSLDIINDTKESAIEEIRVAKTILDNAEDVAQLVKDSNNLAKETHSINTDAQHTADEIQSLLDDDLKLKAEEIQQILQNLNLEHSITDGTKLPLGAVIEGLAAHTVTFAIQQLQSKVKDTRQIYIMNPSEFEALEADPVRFTQWRKEHKGWLLAVRETDAHDDDDDDDDTIYFAQGYGMTTAPFASGYLLYNNLFF